MLILVSEKRSFTSHPNTVTFASSSSDFFNPVQECERESMLSYEYSSHPSLKHKIAAQTKKLRRKTNSREKSKHPEGKVARTAVGRHGFVASWMLLFVLPFGSRVLPWIFRLWPIGPLLQHLLTWFGLNFSTPLNIWLNTRKSAIKIRISQKQT